MKKLNNQNLVEIHGGSFSNRECMLLGGLAFGVAYWYAEAAIGITAAAIMGGCFSEF